MNYLTANNISKTVGEKLLFQNITFGLEKGQKSALIARNGSGKSTLLNILTGRDTPDSGSVVIRNDITVSYLPQMDNFNENDSVIENLFNEDTPIVQVVKEYETCVTLLEQGLHDRVPQPRMDHAVLEMDRLNAWDYEAKIKEILSRFGIDNIFKNVHELSGGQRK